MIPQESSLCPICNKRAPEPDYKPFCSKRCADVDLARWFNGNYAIPTTERAPIVDTGDGADVIPLDRND